MTLATQPDFSRKKPSPAETSRDYDRLEQVEEIVHIASPLITQQMDNHARKRITARVQKLDSAERQSVIDQSLRLITEEMMHKDRIEILNAISLIPSDTRESLITQTLRFVPANAKTRHKIEALDAIKKIPIQDHEFTITLALRFIAEETKMRDRVAILDIVHKIPDHAAESIVSQSLRLIPHNTPPLTLQYIINCIAKIPVQFRELAVSQTLRCMTPSIKDHEIVKLIHLVWNTLSCEKDFENPNFAISQALRLITPTMTSQEVVTVINCIRLILPMQRRDCIISQALRLLTDDMSANNRKQLIELLSQVPVESLEQTVSYVLEYMTPQLTFAHKLQLIKAIMIRDPELLRLPFPVDAKQLFDEQGNPTTPLVPLQKLYHLIEDVLPFPKIQYLESSGVDQGGVTRDFVTRLFKALCHPGQQAWPMCENNHGMVPQITPYATLNEPEQMVCCKAIGAVFARALDRKDFTIGHHFHPVLYQMIHSLHSDELGTLNDPIAITPQNPIYKKLAPMFLKAMYPSLLKDLSNEDIDHLIAGIPSEKLSKSPIDQEFLNNYVTGPLRATLLIAHAMYKYLCDESSIPWNDWKTSRPDALQKSIEGSFNKMLVIHAFGAHIDTPKGAFFRRWIEENTDQAVQKFLFAALGTETLLPTQELAINDYPETTDQHAVAMHTCSGEMDVPNYSTYEAFKKGLETSIVEANVLVSPEFTLL